jgi:hypothetical protein
MENGGALERERERMFEHKIEKITGRWRKLDAEDSECVLFIDYLEHLGQG